jgi:hypothetical protein
MLMGSLFKLIRNAWNIRPVSLRAHLGGRQFGNEEDQMICPVCGCPYNHLTGVNQHRDGSDIGRECVELYYLCESGHAFVVDFREHKGQVFVEMLPISAVAYDSTSSWWKVHNPEEHEESLARITAKE